MTKEAKEIVNHFGLHVDQDEIVWLLQGNNQPTLNVYNLPESDCPFKINHIAKVCHHNFSFKELATEAYMTHYKRLMEASELLRLMGPVPYKPEVKSVYIDTANYNQFMVINDVLEIVNTIKPICSPLQTLKPDTTDTIFRTLDNSNLSRYLIIDCKYDFPRKVDILINRMIGTRGRLFFAGEKRPFYGMDKMVKVMPYDPILEDFLKVFPTRALRQQAGCTQMKEFMRGHKGTLEITN